MWAEKRRSAARLLLNILRFLCIAIIVPVLFFIFLLRDDDAED